MSHPISLPRIMNILLIGISVCIIGFTVWFTYCYYFPFPLGDHLDLMVYLQLYYEQELTFARLIQPHNGDHWHFVSIALLLAIAIATHWDIWYAVMISLFFPLISCFFLYQLIKQCLVRQQLERYALLFLPIIVYFIYSPDQTRVWLWGWQLHNHLVLIGLSGMLYFLYRPDARIRHVVYAGLLSCIATYSFALGLVLWPLGIIVLLSHPYRAASKKKVFLLIWLVFSMLIAVHFVSSEFRVDEISGDKLIWWKLILFPFLFIGAALTIAEGDGIIMLIFGSVGIFLVCRYINNKSAILAWIPMAALMLFSLGSAVMVGLARHYYDTLQPFLPRYISFSNMFWLSAVVMVICYLLHYHEKMQRRWSDSCNSFLNIYLAITLIVILSAKMVNFSYRLDDAKELQARAATNYQLAQRGILQEAIWNDLTLDSNMYKVYQHLPLIDTMEAYRLNGFRDQPAKGKDYDRKNN